MKTLLGAVIGVSVFISVALAVDTQYKTRLITTATLTIHVREGVYLTIKNFTQDTDAPGQRGVVVAGVIPSTPTPVPTATPVPTPTPTLSTSASPSAAVLGDGQKLNDNATLFGDNNPTGTILFTLNDPTNAVVYQDTVTVNGNATYATTSGNNPGGFSPTTAGTYTWLAVYSGDSNNGLASAAPETVIVSATPTPTPVPTPTPTPVFAAVVTAALLNPVAVLSTQLTPTAEFIKPIIIAGPATLTINPVPPATLAITYRKTLQPSGITPTPTPTPSTSSSTPTPTPTSMLSATSTSSVGISATSHSVVATASGPLDDDDDTYSSTPTPTPTPASLPTSTPIATASITPTPTPGR